MIKFIIEDETIKDFEVNGDVQHIAAEISAVIKAIYQLTKADSPIAAEIFKLFTIRGLSSNDSPVWDDNVPLITGIEQGGGLN